MRVIPALLALLLAGPVLAQDSDGDGVPDSADAFPCDAALAGMLHAPSEGGWSLLAFEDQWPGSTDLDYNDVAVRAHFRFDLDAQGRVRRIIASFDPAALGGEHSNGLALRLPTSRQGLSAQRRVGSGAWTPLTFEPDAEATLIVSGDLRELFEGVRGPINSRFDHPLLTGERIELELTFATPVTLDTGLAPFDVFIFRSGDFGHQIHFPGYAGTEAMHTHLFNSGSDASTPGRWFVHDTGTPFALNLQGTTRFPLEAVPIDELFPNIVGFAASAGQSHADFYLSSVVAERGRAMGSPASPAHPAIDRSCLPLDQVFDTWGDHVVSLPAGTYQLLAWGAAGGPSQRPDGTHGGGGGGFAQGTYVHSGGEIVVRVGQGGARGGNSAYTAFGGGGYGGTSSNSYMAGGGGGLSGVFLPEGGPLGAGTLHSRTLLIAGGGGGRGYSVGAGGGSAGQAAANSGNAGGGRGGTQTAGGAGGHNGGGYGNAGAAGSALTGGRGGTGNRSGGGGGGGYYGGGGGGSNNYMGAGGAGGSGFAHPTLLTDPVLTAGSGETPGNASDPRRGTAGSASTTRTENGLRRGFDGAVVISRID